MSLSRWYILLAVLVMYPTMEVWSQSGVYRRVKVPISAQAQSKMQDLGIFPDHLHTEGHDFILEWSDSEISLAQQANIPLEVLVEDVSQWYADRISNHPYVPGDAGGVPNGFHLGSMGGFLTLDEVMAELDLMHAQFPNLISAKDSIGVSVEGRPIYSVVISDNPTVKEDEPFVLYTALHHAREPISMMQLIYFMHHLLENYGQDSLVTYLVKERTLVFVPVVNPDGYVHNQLTNPNGGGMWRKNRRPSILGNGMGVDLNRNYGFYWGYNDVGSSPSQSSNTYRGDSPFSEPETQAIRDLCLQAEFKIGASYHGYGEYLIYPWGFDANEPLPDLPKYGEMAQFMVDPSHFYPGNTSETVGYQANGVIDDWMYGDQNFKPKAFHFSPECGTSDDGFWPIPARIYEISSKLVESNLRLASLAGPCLEPVSLTAAHLNGPVCTVDAKVKNIGLGISNAFALRFTTQNPAVLSVTPSLQQSTGLSPDAEMNYSFNLQIAGSTQPGTWIEGELVVESQGGVRRTLPIRFQFGQPDIVFGEDAESTANSWAGNWARTTERAFSGTSSFTDSPWVVYANNTQNSFVNVQPIDLTTFEDTHLSFKAFWEVDHLHDYVQLFASADGVNFTPMEGRYTWDGEAPYQPSQQPLFEGRRYGWVEERIDLSSYDGGPLFLKFHLASDHWQERDGFYFDDLKVTGYRKSVSTDKGEGHPNVLLMPSPSDGKVRIWLPQFESTEMNLELYDLSGHLVWSGKVFPEQELDLGDLPQGVYIYSVQFESGGVENGKWVRQ